MESLISCKRQTYSWHQVRHAASQHSKREWNQRSQRGVDADVPFISPIKKNEASIPFQLLYYFVRRTNMKQEWAKWNFTALIACKMLYVHSTMKYKTPPFSLLLLLPLQKSSSVHCQMLNCRTQQSRILFFFMVSIEMVVDFLTSLHIEWRVQSNIIQCLKSKKSHLIRNSCMILASTLLRDELKIL